MTPCRILAIGEAYGRQEDMIARPFVGAAGHMLNTLLEESEILPTGSARAISPRYERDPNPARLREEADRRDRLYLQHGIRLTNVFKLRPDGNKIESLCGARWGSLPALRSGKYLREEYLPHLERLSREIREYNPNLILGLGAVSSWFILGSPYISKLRGTVAQSQYGKFLPTFHPASLLRGRSPENRPVVLMDLMKAKLECDFPEVRRPQRFVYVPETINEILWSIREMASAPILSIDIETVEDQITCFGVAWSRDHSLVIPIFDWRNATRSYWHADDERTVWSLIKQICTTPIPKLFQNGLYDIRFLYERYAIAPAMCEHDTMLLHHAMQPELRKGLGFLGSIYSNEASWKLMRPRGRGTIKREDE